jgi:SAM-dependent methyltransferase
MHSSSSKPSALWERHFLELKAFFSKPEPEPSWAAQLYSKLLAHYYRHLIPESASVLEIGCGKGDLLAQLPNRNIAGLDLSKHNIKEAQRRMPHGKFEVRAGELFESAEKFDVIILSDTINLVGDVQLLFANIRRFSHPRTRLVINFYNTLWRPFLSLAMKFGLKRPEPPSNWLSSDDVINLLDLADWQVVQKRSHILAPLPMAGIENLINRFLGPFFQAFCLAIFCVARPRGASEDREYSVSVVVPARNEAGNVEAAILRTPEMGKFTEIIFVEGNSTDNTWEEIQRVAQKFPERRIKILQQSGKGKGNAVRDGFEQATGEILMILDADLTMPPEELPKFYDVLANGHAEFANGVRLVYPMEKEAMRFLNMCANKFFSIAFTWLLSQPVKDTLCGTKVLFKDEYDSIVSNRNYFGNFDPFGDFDLLFGASKLNLKIADVPIRYRDRTYGETNIHRWRHGLLLLKMTAFAARKIKFI